MTNNNYSEPSHINTTIPPTSNAMQTYVLRSSEGDTGDAGDMLQAQLGDLLARLLLVPGVDSDGGPGRNVTTLGVAGLGLVGGLMVLELDLACLFVAEFFDAGAGHGG